MMISSSASNMPKINDDLSPQRGHSFINVVINAIRNATSMAKNRQQQNVLAKVQEVESFHRKTQEGKKMVLSIKAVIYLIFSCRIRRLYGYAGL